MNLFNYLPKEYKIQEELILERLIRNGKQFYDKYNEKDIKD